MNKKTIAITVITIIIAAAMIFGLLFVSWIEKVYSLPENQNNQGEIRAAASYEEIYRLVMDSQEQNNNIFNKLLGREYYFWDDEDYDEYDDVEYEFYLNDYCVYSKQENDISYGDTVAEKDGYIYSVDFSETLKIYDVKNNFEKTEVIIDTEDYSFSIEEANIYQDYLVLIGSSYLETYEKTVVFVYDINNPLNPVRVSENSQEGLFYRSIIKDGYLYIDTHCWKYDFGKEDCVPVVNGTAVTASEVYYVGEVNTPFYNVITSMELGDAATYKEEIAIMGNETEQYFSENAFYFSALDDNDDTEIVKFSYNNGEIEPIGSAVVKGRVTDSFSMNEYNGNLRVYTKNSEKTASLYVLNGDLELFGLTDAIETKNDFSTIRYMGNVAIVIEYMNDNSVCTLDLTDPAEPRVAHSGGLGGFDEYIFMVDKNRIITIYNKNEQLIVAELDISDPENVVEKDVLVLGNYNYSPITVFGKLAFLDSDNSRLGFSVENTNEYDSYVVDYVMISYNLETGLEKIYNGNVYDSNIDGDDYSYLGSDISYSTKSILTGQSLYLFTDGLKVTEIDYVSLLDKNKFDLFSEILEP